MKTIAIGARVVGAGNPCFAIAEVGLTHDGDLALAHEFVDAVAEAGADAVKFQTHIAEAESTPAEPFRVRFSDRDASRYEYWQRTSFTEPQWRELAEHARERELDFLSSPFSEQAVDLLERVGVPAWKIGSGEVANARLLERVGSTGLPVLLSSGLSPWSELDAASETLTRLGAPFAILQATTAYPCPPERLGLNLIGELRDRYDCPVGLSDHSGTIYPALAAVTLGADIVEVHVTLSRDLSGPDVPASVTKEELRQLVDGVRMLETAVASPVDKDAAAEEVADLRTLFTRSVVARADLTAGTVLGDDDLVLKKPGTGIPPDRLGEVVGRRLRRDVKADELLSEDDLE